MAPFRLPTAVTGAPGAPALALVRCGQRPQRSECAGLSPCALRRGLQPVVNEHQYPRRCACGLLVSTGARRFCSGVRLSAAGGGRGFRGARARFAHVVLGDARNATLSPALPWGKFSFDKIGKTRNVATFIFKLYIGVQNLHLNFINAEAAPGAEMVGDV